MVSGTTGGGEVVGLSGFSPGGCRWTWKHPGAAFFSFPEAKSNGKGVKIRRICLGKHVLGTTGRLFSGGAGEPCVSPSARRKHPVISFEGVLV